MTKSSKTVKISNPHEWKPQGGGGHNGEYYYMCTKCGIYDWLPYYSDPTPDWHGECEGTEICPKHPTTTDTCQVCKDEKEVKRLMKKFKLSDLDERTFVRFLKRLERKERRIDKYIDSQNL